ncbi:hypothetical protein LOC71_18700 [Rhodopirellula sp. JC740]|uniref:Uncharacterized protein n=1 Tax=Rhodopirellula halodulae TaxID=2894198 RepID=A0ABS8NL99_9BACT|nr:MULTISPECIES: hypothetical protein [unclassified Rhodopirellula]MCC9644312.1 hypothetical protein [Rhodopirellula sp. JC740]MCC9657475.1 hypothetical protein [Rhodopirellula sp. JC737]
MFAPIPIQPQIFTVHGLTYRVAPVTQKSENEDPQVSRRREERGRKQSRDERSDSDDQHIDREA